MMEIGKPRLTETVVKEEAHSLFIVEPLERGYGTTIGNCLRRILCTALPGAAIIGVEIEGVRHEFSTVAGVKEDVAEIILNLKEIAVKVYSEDTFETQKVKLHKEVGGVITAADIELTSDRRLYVRYDVDHRNGQRVRSRGGKQASRTTTHRIYPDRLVVFPRACGKLFG